MVGLLAYISYKYDEMMVIVNTCIAGGYLMLHGILNYLQKEGLDKEFKGSLEKFQFSKMDRWQTVYVFGILVCFVAGMITQCIFQHHEGYLHQKEKKSEDQHNKGYVQLKEKQGEDQHEKGNVQLKEKQVQDQHYK
jgi:hypothetical protein